MQEYEESMRGVTVGGVHWRWREDPFYDSQLLLYPDVGVPSRDDRWRHEHSLRIRAVLLDLRLPVSIDWVAPVPTRSHREWTADRDCYPQWLVAGDRHAFLYGIVGRLWDSLEFTPQPPELLEREWRVVVLADELDDDELVQHGLGLAPVSGAVQLLGQDSEGIPFQGGPLLPTNLEDLL